MDWSTWLQDVSRGAIGAAVDARFRQPYEIEKLRLQALGEAGYYTEGQAGTQAPAGGIPPAVLLLGGAVLLFVLLKD